MQPISIVGLVRAIFSGRDNKSPRPQGKRIPVTRSPQLKAEAEQTAPSSRPRLEDMRNRIVHETLDHAGGIYNDLRQMVVDYCGPVPQRPFPRFHLSKEIDSRAAQHIEACVADRKFPTVSVSWFGTHFEGWIHTLDDMPLDALVVAGLNAQHVVRLETQIGLPPNFDRFRVPEEEEFYLYECHILSGNLSFEMGQLKLDVE
jgi:hypothetical protein